MAATIQRIGNVFYRVTDMDAAVSFYGDVLGLPLRFRDGNNWAAFDVAGMTLALEGTTTAPGSGGATVSLRVDGGLDALVATLRERGAQVSDVKAGGHERRAELTDPSGNRLVLYEPTPPPAG
jgi:catechol 2,3-dioxygenase-like lactoylglutathione lyase family enzyme